MRIEFSEAQGGTVVTVDYYDLLSRAIEISKADRAHLRHAIYKVARANLDREAIERHVPITWEEYKAHRFALERAIKKIEGEHWSPLRLILSPRVDFAIQATFAIFLFVVILATVAGYIEVHAVKHVVQ